MREDCKALHEFFAPMYDFNGRRSEKYYETVKPGFPGMVKGSELHQLLCEHKAEFEISERWRFGRFCIGWTQYRNPKVFSRIYMLVSELLEGTGISVVIDNGNIEFVVTPNWVGGDLEQEVADAIAWCESVE